MSGTRTEKGTCKTHREKCAPVGAKVRCNYCSNVLTLVEDIVLSDGTQTYAWKDGRNLRKCNSTKHVGIFHRPPEKDRKYLPSGVACC